MSKIKKKPRRPSADTEDEKIKSLKEKDIRELDYWNKRPPGAEDQEVELLSEEAIHNGSSLSREEGEIARFQSNLAALGRDNYCEVVVLSVDIRESSIALVNAEDFTEYSRALTDFVCYIKDTWRGAFKESDPKKKGRFFDKFTGDGVLCFWVLPEEPSKDDADTEDEHEKTLLQYFYDIWNERIKQTIDFSVEITCKFMENFLPSIRKACGLLPKRFGLSIGVDAGECLLTELRSSVSVKGFKDWYREQYGEMKRHDNEDEVKRGLPKRIVVSNNVTVIGRPVIGATRMVGVARPYEILVNCYPGAALKAKIDDPRELEIHKDLFFGLELDFRHVKEYCHGPVEVYRVTTDRIEHLKRELGLVEEDDETAKEIKKEPNSTICKQTKSE